MIPGEHLLEVDDLVIEFRTRLGALTAVDHVTFEIEPGEILGVVGESGAGKSVMASSIVGLLDAPGHMAGGRIRFEGDRIDGLPAKALRKIRGRKIGMIFQDPSTSLHPLFTIGHQIVETMCTHLGLSFPEAKQQCISLLARVGIPEPRQRFRSYPHELSGGMRQRAVIALALCANPRLVIADEPTTALDVTVQAQILELIKNLCRSRGTAVMLITHDIGVIAELADRICVMYAGRIVEMGSKEDVLSRPKHPYTERLMACIPQIGSRSDRLLQISGSMPRLDGIPTGCAFHPRCPSARELCLRERPALFSRGRSQVACWLHSESVSND